jgi:exopolysaccharide production protein ExoZ
VTSAKPKLQSLEAVRALAALSVVLFHTTIIFSARTGTVPFGGVFGAGSRGVDLFFVLSGFIIAFVHKADLNRPAQIGKYAFARFTRIYPSVWITTLLALAVYLAGFGGAGKADKLSIGNFVDSFLLLPQRGDALVNVTWSLKFEIFFYVLFALVILRRSAGVVVIAVWQAAVLALFLSGKQLGWSWIAFYMRPITLEFGIGVLCAWAVIQRTRFAWLTPRIAVTGLLVGCAVFIGAELTQAFELNAAALSPDFLLFGLPAALIVISLAWLDLERTLAPPRFLVALGGASYSIYLVHFSVISLLAAFLTRHSWVPMTDPVFLTVAAVGVAAGMGFHRWVDRPIHRALRLYAPRPTIALIEQPRPELLAREGHAPV